MPASVTRSRLATDIRELGVRPGGIVMVHTRMSALGWVIGGSETVVLALLDALGPEGTLAAYASWQEHVYRPEDWPAEHRGAYLDETPVFDPATGEAARENGRIPERIRTWPGAQRSAQPDASVVAVGARAAWLAHPHPGDHGYGTGTPFARLVEADGQVLLLGAPLSTITLLHHAEALADAPGKRLVTYNLPVMQNGRVKQRTFTDIDTGAGAFPYAQLALDDDEFAVIGRAALAAGIGSRGHVGEAECHLFPARELTRFAVAWLEARF